MAGSKVAKAVPPRYPRARYRIPSLCSRTCVDCGALVTSGDGRTKRCPPCNAFQGVLSLRSSVCLVCGRLATSPNGKQRKHCGSPECAKAWLLAYLVKRYRTDIEFRRRAKTKGYRKHLSTLLMEQAFACALCGETITAETPEVDHIVPRSKGGTNDKANLQAACPECNRSKGNRT